MAKQPLKPKKVKLPTKNNIYQKQEPNARGRTKRQKRDRSGGGG